MRLIRHIAVATLCTVSGLAAAGPVPRAVLATATLQWTDCPVVAPANTRCGSLSVPENWQRPARSRRNELAFAVIASRDAAGRKADPVALLTGGPGVSAFIVLPMLAEYPMAEHRDLIILNPRGFGYSHPALTCEKGFDALAACQAAFRRSGVDPNQYNTESLSHDLEALRIALGVDRWNLFGISYGTFWALHHARLYPEQIRSIVLDSPYPPQAGYKWTRVSALNAFDRTFDACRVDSACDAAYPDLRRRFIDALRKADASPVTVGGRTIDGGELFRAIYHVAYGAPSLALTPKLVDAAWRGDFATILAADASYGPAPADFKPELGYATGLNASVECADDIGQPVTDDTRVAFVRPWPEDVVRLIRPEGWNYDKICADWKVRRSPAILGQPVHSAIPTLILVGAYDPITPPEFAEAAALTLSHATVLLDPSSAHFVATTRHPCIWQAVRDLLTEPTATIDTSCLMTTPPVRWVLPGPPATP